jgi:sulfate-transporting ATPase
VSEFIQFIILGLGLAAAYSLLSCGIVLIYRGSGVVNFAHGAFALIGAIVFHEVRASGIPVWVSIILAVIAGAVLGVVVQNPIMARLRTASPVTRVIATLGILVTIQAAATLHYQSAVVFETPYLPQHTWHVGSVGVQSDRVILFGIAIVVVGALALLQSRVRFALATRAGAENEVAVANLGWSPNLLATANWAIGGGLAALAGALILPLTGLIIPNMVLLVVPALAASLLGRFDSFVGALLGSTFIGICQSLIVRYVHQTGASDAFPFLVIIAVLIITGRGLPVRAYISQRLPSVGSGRIYVVPLLAVTVISVLLMTVVFSTTVVDAVTVSLGVGVVLLSIVLLTGYAGQLSLAQYAMAGIGAFVAGRLVSAQGWPFWLAGLAALVAAIPVGAIFGLPALRTRGITLAVITLGLGVAVNSLLFSNVDYTGGFGGTNVGPTHLFGYDVDALNHPRRYGVVVLVAFLLAALVVANIRRSATGRRLIAIRENERAAASLGLSVLQSKLYAFMTASAIAALGGILIAFQNSSIVYNTEFTPLASILVAGYAVIGGMGYLSGPMLGAILTAGGIATLLNNVLSSIDNYLALIGGIALVLTLMINPDGLASEGIRAMGRLHIIERLRLRRPAAATGIEAASTGLAGVGRVKAQGLRVRGLRVTFGSVTAVNGVDIDVAPGEIVGLIGPNGAGKTTFIDAVTGFVRAESDELSLGDHDLRRASAAQRAGLGVVRSWQSLELFEDVSVLENMRVASESVSRSWLDDIRSMLWPARRPLSSAALAAIEEFRLTEDLERKPGDLSYGRRRLVGIGRAVALTPSVLLLDEPAAGLSSTESAELGALVTRLAQTWGIGVLLIEHDVDLVMGISDRVVVLDFGTVIAEGPPEQVRADPAVIAAYLGEPDEQDDELGSARSETERTEFAGSEGVR